LTVVLATSPTKQELDMAWGKCLDCHSQFSIYATLSKLTPSLTEVCVQSH